MPLPNILLLLLPALIVYVNIRVILVGRRCATNAVAVIAAFCDVAIDAVVDSAVSMGVTIFPHSVEVFQQPIAPQTYNEVIKLGFEFRCVELIVVVRLPCRMEGIAAVKIAT